MNLGDLVPWSRRDQSLALRNRDAGPTAGGEISPFLRLHQEMNRLFDDVFRSFDAPGLASSAWPHLDVEETDRGWRVTAELPGLDEKDIDLSVQDGALVLRGEKRAETERPRGYSERFWGRFERRIALPDVDEAGAKASFDKGVLTIELPRSTDAEARVKRIPINAGGPVH